MTLCVLAILRELCIDLLLGTGYVINPRRACAARVTEIWLAEIWLAEAAGKYGRLAVWSGVTLDEHTWSRGLLSDESYTLDHGGMGSPFSAIADVHTD